MKKLVQSILGMLVIVSLSACTTKNEVNVVVATTEQSKEDVVEIKIETSAEIEAETTVVLEIETTTQAVTTVAETTVTETTVTETTVAETTTQNETEGSIKDKSTEAGEGIGYATMPSQAEIDLMYSYTTSNWDALTEDAKWTAIQTIVRMWEIADSYVGADIDSMLMDMNYQMNVYSKNGVTESLFNTMCDVYGINESMYSAEVFAPSYPSEDDVAYGTDGVIAIMPVDDQISGMLNCTTSNWNIFSDDAKLSMVQTVLQMWQVKEGIVLDASSVLMDMEFQMNAYINNGVEISLFDTMCDVYGVDASKY